MPKVKDKAAYEIIIRGRIDLLLSNGFFGFLAMQLNIIEDYTVPTAAVDGVNFYYNPDFVKQLDPQEVEFLWAHECMHCCFQHFARRGGRSPIGWNIAGDFVINLDLKNSGFKLIHNRPINGKTFKCCIDEQYAGMTTEQVYDKLPKITIDLTNMIIGEVKDSPGDKREAEHQWEINVRGAIQVAIAQNAGNVPGSLKNLIKALNEPKISWRDKTAQFIDQSLSKDWSWGRINRRSTSIGVLLPGLVSDRLHKLVFISDVSGSVSHKMQAEMLSEVGGALDQGTCDELVVAYADTKVQHVDEFFPGDVVESGKYTGGGTAFSDSFRWLKENHPDAACVIYLTDLEVYDFGEDPGIPVMWAVYNSPARYEELSGKTPFGTSIFVSETT